MRRLLESTPAHLFRWLHSMSVRHSYISGPPYRPSHRRIIIDITEACDLRCVDCSRSCGEKQASSDAHMTRGQISKFIRESIQQDKEWGKIQIEGGEPTLHPDFLEIVGVLADYVKEYTPDTLLQVNTNGYSPASRDLVKRLPPGVQVYCSAKTQPRQKEHLPVNCAPIDLAISAKFDFSQGCYLPALYGLGLNRYGYYPHPNCGAIDRVLGFDIGRKSLPSPNDNLVEQFSRLCRYCGLFPYFNREAASLAKAAGIKPKAGTVSTHWRQAYGSYSVDKPVLTEY